MRSCRLTARARRRGRSRCSLAACDLGLPAGRAPHREGNRLDMVDQPKLKPQRATLRRRATGGIEPPAGRVAVGETPYPYRAERGRRAPARSW